MARRDRGVCDALRTLVDSASHVGLALFDPGTRAVQAANACYARLHGLSIDAVIGRVWGELGFAVSGLSPDAAFDSLVDGAASALETIVQRGDDGEATLWRVCAYALRSETSGAPHIALCAMDITSQEHARVRLQAMNQQQSDFISLAGHELRTPLVPLSAYVDTLELLLRAAAPRDQAPDPRVAVTLGNVWRQLAHVVRLTDDLLDIARIDSGHFDVRRARVDLREVVGEAVALLRQGHPGTEVVVEQDAVDPLWIDGDAQRLHQVLSNLFDNALRFGALRPIEVTLERIAGDRARIVVEDQGPGIDPAVRERVFEKSFQAAPAREGFGLGLFICRSIVHAHGGTIRAADGMGARLQVDLPLSTA